MLVYVAYVRLVVGDADGDGDAGGAEKQRLCHTLFDVVNGRKRD